MRVAENTRLWIAVLVVAAGLWSAGCDEKLSSVAGPTPTLEPTLSSISREIFNASDATGRRACVACHTNVGRTPAGGLNLLESVAWSQLVSVDSVTNRGSLRVVPGDPDNSILVKKIEGAPGMVGQRMPIGGPPYLTAGQILIIRRWIQDGAKNN